VVNSFIMAAAIAPGPEACAVTMPLGLGTIPMIEHKSEQIEGNVDDWLKHQFFSEEE
jgi:hypothetical protein